MPLYDLMLLLDPGVPSDRQEAILKDVQGQLESGGKLVGTYDWGTRRMTFEIDHRPEAAYHLFQFEAEGGGALLERVDHSLKIMDGVLRHRIIRLKDGSIGGRLTFCGSVPAVSRIMPPVTIRRPSRSRRKRVG